MRLTIQSAAKLENVLFGTGLLAGPVSNELSKFRSKFIKKSSRLIAVTIHTDTKVHLLLFTWNKSMREESFPCLLLQ